jgi:hypothetical protein
MPFQLTSPAFAEGAKIPKRFSCDGDNLSPALEWQAPPAGVKSFALIMDDPDAPMGTFVHWVLFNMPGEARALPEGVARTRQVQGLGEQGVNGARQTGFTGPCPPGGTHRYFFKLFALDAQLAPSGGPSAADLEKAMQGHILAQAQLMGRYTR